MWSLVNFGKYFKPHASSSKYNCEMWLQRILHPLFHIYLVHLFISELLKQFLVVLIKWGASQKNQMYRSGAYMFLVLNVSKSGLYFVKCSILWSTIWYCCNYLSKTAFQNKGNIRENVATYVANVAKVYANGFITLFIRKTITYDANLSTFGSVAQLRSTFPRYKNPKSIGVFSSSLTIPLLKPHCGVM